MSYHPTFVPQAFMVWLGLLVVLLLGYMAGPDQVFQSIALVILFGHACVGVFLLVPVLATTDTCPKY